MLNVEIRGTEQLVDLGKKLKGADKEIKRDLAIGINRAVKPLKQDVKQSALRTLPKRGGYAKLIGKSAIRTKRRMSGPGAGIRVMASNKFDIKRLDGEGRLRHPLFGNRSWWYEQSVLPGWFTRPMRDGAGKVRRELVKVMDDITERLARR